MSSFEDRFVEMIEEVVDEKLADLDKRDADDISGLEEFVDNCIERTDKKDLNTDDIEGLDDFVRDECMSALNDNFQRLLHKVLTEDDDVRKALEKFIRQTVSAVLTEALQGLLLKGQS